MTDRLRRLTIGPGAWAILAAVILHGVVPAPLPLVVRGPAALLLTGAIPGALLVEWLVGAPRGHPADAPLDAWERGLYSMGAGVSVIIVTMLALSYLPGPILAWQTFVAFDAIIVVLAVGCAWRAPGASGGLETAATGA